MERIIWTLSILTVCVSADIFIAASDPRLVFLGRSVLSESGRYYDWTGGQIRFSVSNTTFVDVVIQSPSGFRVIIDGEASETKFMTEERTKVAEGIDGTNHTVAIWKTNEPYVPRGGVRESSTQ